MLEHINKQSFNNGVFLFENGKYIFIEEIQYSTDGTFWEEEFIPYEHPHPNNPTVTVKGHRYRRVRHAGDYNFQEPEYIVAEDGKTPIIEIVDGVVYSYYEGDDFSDYNKIVAVEEIKGDKGDKGDVGQGWHIDYVGYYEEKPECSQVQTVKSSCNECGDVQGSLSAYNLNYKLFLSLGDGLYTIEAGDVGSFYSKDGDNWIEIVATDVNKKVRFIADDASGTGSLDYKEQDTLNTKGKVYICADGRWTPFLNVSIPYHKLAPNETYYTSYQDGFFMDRYVGVDYSTSPDNGDTIYMDSEFNLRIKENSISAALIKDGTFIDGLDEGITSPNGYKTSSIKIKPSDFAGYGLDVYTSDTDSYVDIQAKPSDYIKDGLFVEENLTNNIDGETKEELFVKVQDLVDTSESGLEAFENSVDGYYDIKVKDSLGLIIDSTGLNVDVDDYSIAINISDKISVKEDGIHGIHLNTDVANENRGISLVEDQLRVILSSDHIALGFDATGLLVEENGIQGWHLNDNIVDTSKGTYFNDVNDTIEVNLDPSGGLKHTINGIGINTDDLSWLNFSVVKKIEVGGLDVSGDIVIEGDTTSDTYMNITASLTGQTITITPNTNLSALESLIDSRITASANNNHLHDIEDVTGLQTALDSKLDKDLSYGNIKVVTTGTQAGLHIQSPDGSWGRLIVVDNEFNLGVESVT